jgi:zinc/manganese transport system permease protein
MLLTIQSLSSSRYVVQWIFEPGLFDNSLVRTALLIGLIVAFVSSCVGIFAVMRGQSFAGHALTDVAAAGGAGALYAGVAPLLGFVGAGVLGAGAMDAIGVQRVKGRDIATGVVLGASTGLAALFLYLSATSGTTTGSTQLILFGSIFTVQPSTVPGVAGLSAVVLVVLGVLARPLLLSSISPELAAARGVRVRVVSLVFIVVLAVSVGLSAIVIGSILSTALLIGPPASALKVARRFANAVALSVVLGVVATSLGIVLSYDSYYWFASHRGLPVSFCVVAVVVVQFALASAAQHLVSRRVSAPPIEHGRDDQLGWH